MGFLGGLINAAVGGVAGGLRGQNEGDNELYTRRQQEHEQMVREYAAQQALERQKAEDASEAGLRGAQEDYYRRSTPYTPQTLEELMQLEGAKHPGSEHNIDRLSDDGIQRELRLQRGLSAIPPRARPKGSGSGNPGEDIKNLNSTIDDTDREVGRAEKDAAALGPWSPAMLAYPDSAAYENGVRQPAQALVGALRGQRDQFSAKRNDLVRDQFGIGAVAGSGSSDTGPASDRALGHAAAPYTPGGHTPGSGGAGSSTVRPGTGAGSARLSGPDPQEIRSRIQQLTTDYQKALAERGPNGEKRDPAKLQARYIEQLERIERGE
jgi:hypothetical protein